MPDSALIALGLLELGGLIALFVLSRRAVARRTAGGPRPPRLVRIATALVALVVVVGFPAVMILSIVNPTLWAERRRDDLVRTGTRATAVIHHVEETGTFVNRRPEVRLLLTVHPEGAPAFDAQATWVFTVSDVQTYRVGVTVDVSFDPDDRAHVAVVGLAAPPS